jgi:hypothetical protein
MRLFLSYLRLGRFYFRVTRRFSTASKSYLRKRSRSVNNISFCSVDFQFKRMGSLHLIVAPPTPAPSLLLGQKSTSFSKKLQIERSCQKYGQMISMPLRKNGKIKSTCYLNPSARDPPLYTVKKLAHRGSGGCLLNGVQNCSVCSKNIDS